MGKKILIVDCGVQIRGEGGAINHRFADTAKETLEALGHEVKLTRLQDDFDSHEEALKMVWADTMIVQTPGWWMSTPWQFKRYEDLVFTEPELYANDGRSRSDPSRKYGSGGRNTGKTYLISSTWNAPLEAFEDPSQFFEGRGSDGVFFSVNKSFEFLGYKALPPFMANDVIKAPKLDEDIERWKAHLKKVFG